MLRTCQGPQKLFRGFSIFSILISFFKYFLPGLYNNIYYWKLGYNGRILSLTYVSGDAFFYIWLKFLIS